MFYGFLPEINHDDDDNDDRLVLTYVLSKAVGGVMRR